MRPGSLIEWLEEAYSYLLQLLYVHLHGINRIIITQQGDIAMAPSQDTLPQLVAGTSAVFTANLFDSSGNPVTDPTITSQVTLVWQTNSTDISIAASGNAGDMNATVTASATASTGEAELLVSFKTPLSDGSNPNGSAPLPLLAASPVPPPSFAVASIIIVPAAA